ncbi:YbjN domain-containing protein [Corynebacterium variabile]|uniref:YbjN domain-containing protein n=1 Tax=Corynebacterium variabile TaxID=1727 RepID=UPI0028E2806C|nr:YbjN domain-containing protein [Corynebacterium variabile]
MSDTDTNGDFRTDDLTGCVPDIVLRPVTRHRVMDALERAGIAYTVDVDREVSGRWENGRIWFDRAGKDNAVLSVTGYWKGWLPEDRRRELLETCNDWNERMLYPHAYVSTDDDGDLHVVGHHAVDCTFGVTDEQLYQHIDSAAAVMRCLFGDLTEQYPEGVPD